MVTVFINTASSVIFCQHCSAENAIDESSCSRCGKKLLVISTQGREGRTVSQNREGGTLEEHLVERVSLLEEALRATVGGLQRSVVALRRLERANLVGQAGLAAIEEVLANRGVVAPEEFREAWNEHLREGLLAAEKHQALEDRRDLIAADFAGEEPELFQVRLDEASEAFAVFDLDGALEYLDQALQLDANNPQLAALAGELHFLSGRSSRALERFDGALVRDPEQYEALVYSGVLLHEASSSASARQRLRRAVELKPEEFLGWLGLGSLCLDRGDLREASVYLERALELDRVPTALGLLGQAYRRMGKFGRAATMLEEAVRMDPTADEFLYELGRSYVARGWGKKGQETLTAALSLNPAGHHYGVLADSLPAPDAGIWQSPLQRATEFSNAGHFSDARRLAERVLLRCHQAGPLSKAGALMIESLRAEGRLQEGVDWAEKLLELDDPLAQFVANYEIALNLAELEEDLDRALAAARRGTEIEVPELRAQAVAALGWVHYKRNELDQALTLLHSAVEMGGHVLHLKFLGIVQSARGETELAAGYLDEAEVQAGGVSHGERLLRDQLLDRKRLSITESEADRAVVGQQALGLPAGERTIGRRGHE